LSISDVALTIFGGLGRVVAGLCGDLEMAGIRIYPPAYGSLVLLLTVISSIGSVVVAMFLLLLNFSGAAVILATVGIPLTVFGLGVMYPRIKLADRSSSLASEVPFAAAYTAVMSTGGISPYVSITRLRAVPLLPSFAKSAKIVDISVRGMGQDPVTALEKMAKSTPNSEFRELLLGYASTLRSGGDVVHYLLRRTELLFQERLSSLKRVGENVAQIMEIYMAITIVMSLGIYSIFAISMALSNLMPETGGMMFSDPMSFFLFGYIVMPLFSVIFLWLTDIIQPKYPVEDNSPYLVFALTGIPLALASSLFFFIPFLIPSLTDIGVFRLSTDLLLQFTTGLGLERGYESSIGLLAVLVVATLPAAAYNTYTEFRERGIELGLSNFLRDLVEARKSGLSPEKCIINLSARNYGTLSPHLKVIAKQLGWGRSFQEIYKEFSRSVRSWLSKISMFLLVDAISVGGGTPETLETLARFNESTISMEKEKKSMMRPLLLVPYLGMAILVFVIVTLLTFFRSIVMLTGKTVPFADLVRVILPPLIINVYGMGLVGGKIASGKVSSGFIHAVLLLILTFVALSLSPYYSVGVAIPGG
jgi:flagellar protein FlaJ